MSGFFIWACPRLEHFEVLRHLSLNSVGLSASIFVTFHSTKDFHYYPSRKTEKIQMLKFCSMFVELIYYSTFVELILIT